MSIVVCKLPKAGLGNQLFPMMNAFVFGELNGLKVMVTGYHQFKPGPFIRNEKTKRQYTGYFKFQKNIFGEWMDSIKVSRLRKLLPVEYEPALKKWKQDAVGNQVFLFEKLPVYQDYFVHLKPYRESVKKIFYGLLNPAILQQAQANKAPVIGVHIRMGDFRKLKAGEAFKGGHVRMPEQYFIDIIEGLRRMHGSCLPVSVFTDGRKAEFTGLFKLENIHLVEGNTDIVDLLVLSNSKIIVSSSGSTFSYWAGFLSDVPLLLHKDHIYESIRPAANDNQYEGAFDENNPFLKSYIKNIIPVE